MPEAMLQVLELWNHNWVLLTAVLSLVAFFGSIVVVGFLLVKLPATYFQDMESPDWWLERHPLLRWTGLVLKNVLGVVLIALGVVFLIGPGQGVLTILIGVMLVNFPGKRRLERKLVGQPRVLNAINRLRARFGKAPLVLHAEASAGPPQQVGGPSRR
jgi:hypothetical protein